MDEKDLLKKFLGINTWKKGDERAPHKPLLILYAMQRLQQGKRFSSYEEVEKPLETLLEQFGPARKTKAYYPFVYLCTDKIWTLNQPELNDANKDKITATYLKKHAISAGFTTEIYEALKNNLPLQKSIVTEILDQHFPETLHQDILDAIGLDFEIRVGKKQRNPEFRTKILEAYEYKCAICNYNIRIANQLAGVEAAHIKWHQAGGPDIEPNGIAMCALHHKLFDLGAFKLDENYRLLVSQKVSGSDGLEEWLLRFHKKAINRPVSSKYYPSEEFVSWHVKEVFKGYERE